jgi:mannose-1-phosphate guanylyltransferase/mannose-6-phosphate isomerase
MENLCVVTLGGFAGEAAAQAAALGKGPARHILCEPQARNTAAAVAYAADYVRDTFGDDAVLWIFPADHHIEDEAALGRAYQAALAAVDAGGLVTFGINPARPETGYGYIKLGAKNSDAEYFNVDAFVEKPNRAVAEQYVASGEYLWNSGMFLFTAKAVLAQFEAHAPGILKDVRAARAAGEGNGVDAAMYGAVESAAFDNAIMEKTDRAFVVPCDPMWSDIGAWESLWEMREKDANGVATEGRVVTENARDCLVISSGRLIGVAGVSNLVIVDTGDAVLVADRTNSDSLKALVKALKGKGYGEVSDFLPVQAAMDAAA